MEPIKRYTAKELRSCRLSDLVLIGDQLGLTFSKHHNKQARAKRILAAYSEGDLRNASVLATDSSTSQVTQTPGGPRPKFEELIDTGSSDAEPETQTGQRGGDRPGAGRPEGVTAEVAAYNRLSKQPHPAIKMALEKLFEKWSQRAKCPAIKLTKDEAVALALPWTHVLELSPWSGKLPPWLLVGITCTWTTWAICDTKAALAREAAQQRRLNIPDASQATEAHFEQSGGVAP